jgi:ABC-type anion transport system duplicated permease subunit
MSWYPTTACAVYWSILCLITASAVVAVGDHGVHRYGVGTLGTTRVGIKEGLTVLALTFGVWTSH